LALATRCAKRVACHAQAADGNAEVIAGQLCAERGFEALACLGGADAAPACADDPSWADGRRGCDNYAEGQIDHDFCAEDRGDDGRTAAAACPVACSSCPEDDGPAARLSRACDHACSLQQLLGGGGGGLLRTTDVPPLKFEQYQETSAQQLALLQTLKMAYDVLDAGKLTDEFWASLAAGAAGAADPLAAGAAASAERMAVYHGLLQQARRFWFRGHF
jgi:hypothetical protein